MPRSLTSATETELSASTVRPVFLFQLETVSTTIRYCTTTFNITWSSLTFTGNGLLRGFSSIRESTSLGADGLEVTLSGESSAVVSLFLSDLAQNKQADLWLGFLDSSLSLIADPFLAFQGYLDRAVLDDDPDISTLTLHIESRLIELEKSKGLRYNGATQENLFSGDVGFEYIEQLSTNLHWYWGKHQRRPGKKKKRRSAA